MRAADRRTAAPSRVPAPRLPRKHWLRIAAAVVVLGAAAGTWRAWGRAGGEVQDALLRRLARELDAAPALGPRMSVSSAFRPCAPAPAPSPLGYARCAPPARWAPSARMTARVARAVREKADAASLHASALIDLHLDAGAGISTGRAISSLQAVRGMTDRPAPVLSDLAAAYLVRADHSGDPRDLLEAANLAEEALRHAPGYGPALYNRALALQRFGLVDAAGRAWEAYLRADSASGWGEAARQALRQTMAADALPAAPPADAPSAAHAAYARADPQGARALGWNRLLADWAGAVLEGDAARADAALRLAETAGAALERRPGDATLADAVRAIRARPAGPGLARLARAHRDYAAGAVHYDSLRFAEAEGRFRAAVAAAGDSPTLLAWARVYLGTSLVQVGRGADAEPVLRGAVAAADTLRHPALAARARWTLAGMLLRADRYEASLEFAPGAARLFGRAGEREHQGAVLEVLCNVQFALHDMEAGYASAHRALVLLRPYRASMRLHNVLGSIAEAAATDGLLRAAMRVQDEAVETARRNGNPVIVAEARLTRARLLAAGGAAADARRDVDAGRTALAGIPDEGTRGWLQASLQIATAGISALLPPSAAAAAYDSAADAFHVRGFPFHAFPAVVGGADARLAAGDLAGGAARLEAAFAMLEQRRDSIRMEPRRAAVFDRAGGVVDRVVMLRLAAGRPADALAWMDRGRASLAPVGRGGASAAGAPEARAGEVALEYALVGDTLLAWTVRGRRVSLARTVVDRAELVRTAAHLRSQLERGAREAEVRDALSRLYDWLVRPVEDRLGPPETPLVIVADGELAGVPFAALRDRRRGRYLVQDHPLRFAASLREALRAPRRRAGAEGPVFVADPAFDPGENPRLERLAGAAQEARSIAAEYARARVLADRAATAPAVTAALGRAGLVHYAGHAVFDDERPERSYLALAPQPGRPGSGMLTAGELARLDLDSAPLVVLAACRSVSAGQGRASGFSGLAGALLAAGAEGVVGAAWEVDDALTRPLMIEFHRAYRSRGAAASALRAAQLRLLGSADPALRSPAAWAGFRYVGR